MELGERRGGYVRAKAISIPFGSPHQNPGVWSEFNRVMEEWGVVVRIRYSTGGVGHIDRVFLTYGEKFYEGQPGDVVLTDGTDIGVASAAVVAAGMFSGVDPTTPPN